jgi:hypothetical protein
MVAAAKQEAAAILAEARVTAETGRFDREHARTVRVVLVESALAQLEQPLHGEVGLVDDLTSRLSNATD